ncbi:MAG: thioredoxin domain-containing protein [Anaerolineaceae bacterium]
MSKRDDQKKNKKARQQKGRIYWILGIVAVAVVVVLVLVLGNRPAQTAGEFTRITPNPRPQADGLSMGDPNAPVKIVEFADFQCPGCKSFFETVESTMVEKYIATGEVYYTFSPFSFVDEFPGAKGSESKDAAAAAYCAADQNKFWEYHDMLYTNLSGENSGSYTQVRLLAFGEALGLNMTDFKTCVTSNKYQQRVLEANSYAEKNKVTGTPTFLVNGVTADTTTLFDTIDAAIAKGSN